VGGAVAYLLTRPAQVRVPPVVGYQQPVATTILRNAGFVVTITQQSSNQSAGTVIGEIPNGGTKADKRSTVQLTVSSGPSNVTVPLVVGEPLAQAKAAIRNAQLGVGRVIYQSSSSQPTGQVTATDPTADTTVSVGSKIAVFVSSGPAKVQVPDVTGESQAQAKSDLHNAGFSVSVTQQPTSDPTQVGNVIGQSPHGGTSLAQGSTVTIVVGRTPTTATVPDVTGQSAAAATSALQGAGFTVTKTHKKVTNKSENGIVLSQSPKGGTSANKGSAVTITVGHYSSTTPTTPTTPITPTPPTTTTP
jgi:serine/threonine-protein kinase